MYNNLVSLNSWKASYNNASFKRLASNNEIYRFIREHIPRPNTKFRTVLEVGSYPGTYLSEFGEMGFELYGVDVEPKNSIELPEQFRRFNYKIGKFYCQEFESLSIDKKYDVVCSFGFIEHYKNFEEILISHAELVNHKGYLLITAPNFRGGYRIFFIDILHH